MDCSPLGSSVHGHLQARILKWVVIPFSWGSSQPRDWTQVCCIAGIFFTVWATREGQSGRVMVLPPLIFNFSKLTMGFSVCMCMCFAKICSSILYLGERTWTWKSFNHVQLFVTPWNVHGIIQAGILEWVAFSFSRGSSQPRDRTQVSHIAGRFFTSWATRDGHIWGKVEVNNLSFSFWIFKGGGFMDILDLDLFAVNG